jgi:methionine biosynthesis protein MetW
LTSNSERQRFSYEKIAEVIPERASVLDLGCGDGELLQLLRARRRVEGRGVEIDEAKIRQCVQSGISVFQADLDAGLKEFSTGSYDYVILNETLQVVRDPVALLEEMVRVGRHAIINFPNFGYVLNRIQLFFAGRMPVNREIPFQWYNTPNIHFCTRRDFVRLCEELSLRIEETIDLRRDHRIPAVFANLFSTECCFVIAGRDAAEV